MGDQWSKTLRRGEDPCPKVVSHSGFGSKEPLIELKGLAVTDVQIVERTFVFNLLFN